MQITHKLSAAYAEHFADLLRQAAAYDRNALIERGKASVAIAAAEESERQAQIRRTVISSTMPVIQKVENLPESKVPYALSPDGSTMIGESKENA